MQDFLRPSPPALSIKTAVTAPVERAVVRQAHDVLTQEPRGLWPRGGDPRLGFGECQFAVISQERTAGRRDLLGFAAWPAKPAQPSVRIASLAQASIGRSLRVEGRDRWPVTTQAARRLWQPRTAHRFRRTSAALPRWIDSASVATGRGWEEGLVDNRIEFAQVDAPKEGAPHRPVRAPAERGVVAPVFVVSRPQQVLDQPQEAVVVASVTQYRQSDRRVQTVATSGDVARDKPLRSHPPMVALP